MNLTERAHAQGIYVTTAYRWYREGTLPVPAQKLRAMTVGSVQGHARRNAVSASSTVAGLDDLLVFGPGSRGSRARLWT